LNGVRSEIEQQQAEFEALSKQVETAAITVSLHSEAEANVFGLHWRPLYELKLVAMQSVEGLSDYATAMFSLVSISRRFYCGWQRSLPKLSSAGNCCASERERSLRQKTPKAYLSRHRSAP
jgi:hypothetical protein